MARKKLELFLGGRALTSYSKEELVSEVTDAHERIAQLVDQIAARNKELAKDIANPLINTH